MRVKFLKLLSVFLISLLLQNCVGFGAGVIRGEILESAGVSNEHFITLSSDVGEFSDQNLRDKSTRDYYKTPIIYTKQEIINLWGQPSYKKTDKDGSEVWVYRRELAWSGLIAYVAVIIPLPLPLIAPVGTRNTELYFEGENLKRAVYYDGDIKNIFGVGCGLFYEIPEWVCGISIGEKQYSTK